MKKKFLIFNIFVFIIICFATLNIFYSDLCKTFKIFSAAKNLNYNHIRPCISKGNMDHNIKKLLINYPTLYEFARKIKKKYYSGSSKDLLNLEISKTQIDLLTAYLLEDNSINIEVASLQEIDPNFSPYSVNYFKKNLTNLIK